jgi:hypothetical protein
MINAKTFLRQCLLAVALTGTALAAVAGPTNFHVDLNTAGVANAQYIDFLFTKVGGAAPATVTVSNFTGGFGAVDYLEGAVTPNGNGSITIGNGPDFLNLLEFAPAFGGTFGFDLAFSTEFLGSNSTDGSTFSVSLVDATFAPLSGFVQFDLSSANGIVVNDPGTFATITAVPEPSDMLLMMTGLGLVGFTVRRRKAPAAR